MDNATLYYKSLLENASGKNSLHLFQDIQEQLINKSHAKEVPQKNSIPLFLQEIEKASYFVRL